MSSSLQAYLWKDDLVFRYFFVLGFHLFLLRWLHIALTPGLHVRTIISICNISFTVLEIHIWVRRHLMSLKKYFAGKLQLGVHSWLWVTSCWLDPLHLLSFSLAPPPTLARQQLHQNSPIQGKDKEAH